MKPIFNDMRNDIVGGVIENIFYMTYSDGGEQESNLEISISQDELRRLRQLIDRAITKTDVLQQYLEKLRLRVRVYENNY